MSDKKGKIITTVSDGKVVSDFQLGDACCFGDEKEILDVLKDEFGVELERKTIYCTMPAKPPCPAEEKLLNITTTNYPEKSNS